MVRLAQVIAVEGIGSFLEVGTRYVADCEGDVPLCTRLSYLSGASLEEGIPPLASLKDGDSAWLSQYRCMSLCAN